MSIDRERDEIQVEKRGEKLGFVFAISLSSSLRPTTSPDALQDLHYHSSTSLQPESMKKSSHFDLINFRSRQASRHLPNIDFRSVRYSLTTPDYMHRLP
jgi:hypothetical protein